MKRFHLFEWEDLPWLPGWLRRYLTELLRHQAPELYEAALPVLERWLATNGCDRVVDLCSGAGGPWPSVAAELARRGRAVEVLLTDLYPAPGDRVGGPVRHHGAPVDARAVPASLPGCRTLFTGLHHFRPAAARRILADAAGAGVPMAVFEFTERRRGNAFGMLLSPLAVWADTPAVRPFRWGRLFWTYVVPVVPLLYGWDGLVSHLRTYGVEELEVLTEGLERPGYTWVAGRVGAPGAAVTYLLGGAAQQSRSCASMEQG